MSEINSSPYKGSAQITREQFLFYEMRTTAKLMREGLNDNEIIDRIVEDNLFQYPTEKSIRQMAKACVNRLKAMGDEDLIEAVASQSSETAKQICMYAMMKQRSRSSDRSILPMTMGSSQIICLSSSGSFGRNSMAMPWMNTSVWEEI